MTGGSNRLTRTIDKPRTGIVHLGPGAFFRAFSAVYTDEAMAQAGGDWGIVAVSLKSQTARDQLVPQGGAYTSVTLSASGETYQIISAISDVLVAPEDPQKVIAAMADPAVKVVSLTITEKGYCHAPATGALDLDHPDIRHDLSQLDAPRSAVGFIVAALSRRRAADIPPFTVLSCDNLPSNGAFARRVVIDFAQVVDPDLAGWIRRAVTFPATMVDRITPATTPDDVARLEQAAGYHDPACVMHESFRQWVIEDSFVDGRPAWEQAGAQLVRDVQAFELMKLRCLNGTHSTLAYLGYLAGYQTISDCVADQDFAALCRHLWTKEIIPTLTPPDGEDLNAYADTLLARYRDPSIRHRTWQIAMDGSQKLPQRILGTILDNLAMGREPRGLYLAVAAWMRYVGGTDETGAPIDVRDPLAARLRSLCDAADDEVAALLTVTEVFGAEFPMNTVFVQGVRQSYEALTRFGARRAVAAFVSEE